MLAIICLPLFNNLIETTFVHEQFQVKEVAAAVVILALLVGLLAAIYPSLVMSGLRPLNMMPKAATYRLSLYLPGFWSSPNSAYALC